MKQVTFLVMVGFLATLVSCKKDKKETDPETTSLSIQFVNAPDQYAVFDTIYYSISATVPPGVVSASASVLIEDVLEETSFSSGLDSALVSISDTLQFVLGPDEIAASIRFSFTLTDLLGVTLTDTISAIVAESDIDFIFGRSLAGFNNGVKLGSFYDVIDDTAYFPSNIRNKTALLKTIDLVYCFDATVKRSFAVPDADWIEKVWNSQSTGTFWPMQAHENTTLIYDLGESADFESVVSIGEITDLIGSKSPVDSITFVVADRVIAFRLDSLRDSKVGILKVVETSGSSISDAAVTIDIKIQK